MSSKQKKLVSTSTHQPEKFNLGQYLFANLYWIVPSVIATIVSVVTAYYQFYKYVEATLTVPYMEEEIFTENEMVYKIGILINNQGNLPIHISDATIFATDKEKIFGDINFDNLKTSPIENNIVMPNDMRSFSLRAKINKESFYKYSALAQKKNDGNPVDFKIDVGVILTGGDTEFWRAVTDISITTINKEHFTPYLNFKSAEFKKFDPSKPDVKYDR